MQKNCTIGLFGFGCVGQGLYETLKSNAYPGISIKKIAIKNPDKPRSLPSSLFTTDPNAILEDPEINLVVELIDDADEALNIARKALAKGKGIVTANKKMVAENLETLENLQNQFGRQVLYEGAVCGSIPIMQTLENYYRAEKINSIEGILNGSTNYILTKVLQENKSYSEALGDAQKNGFAETDPTLDVAGFDPSYKLKILLRHAMGINVDADRLFRWGIERISRRDIRFASEHCLRIKLLAKAVRFENGYQAFVAPHFVGPNDPFYHIENEFNAICIDGRYAGKQMLTGKGAGSLPTGLAVLSDVIGFSSHRHYHYPESTDSRESDNAVSVYLSFGAADSIELHHFEMIHEHFLNDDGGYITGLLRLDTLKSILTNDSKDLNVIFSTKSEQESTINMLKYDYHQELRG